MLLLSLLSLLSLLACTSGDTVVPAPAAAPAVETSESTASPVADKRGGVPIQATLSFGDRATHMVDVELVVPTAGMQTLELSMPVWTPGSYLVREYARNLEGFVASNAKGLPLNVVRSAKNRWQVKTNGVPEVIVRYRLYAREASVRGNFVDGDLAVLNGAPTFLVPTDELGRGWWVKVDLPEDWSGVYTGLDPAPQEGTFVAADFDELVDSPWVFGSPVVHEFEAGERAHRLVLAGELGPWQVEQSAADVEKIVAIQHEFWGDVPYEHYTFLQVVNERGGGLEHLDSTLMQARRAATSTREDYIKWLGLVSHEFFHTWNIKRLRPRPLGPFDYENEVVTPSLWVAEGLTSYYDDLLLIRAGLLNEEEYLDRLTTMMTGLQDTPGRQVQTLQQSSADAWIKHYRGDENTVNTAVSYYVKGALVGFILDGAIQANTGGEASLDDALRLAYERYSGTEGYTPEQFEAVLMEVGGAELEPVIKRCLRTTEELEYDQAMAWFGLRFADPDASDSDGEEAGEAEPEDPTPGWLGATTATQAGRRVVTELKRGTPAHGAGLQVDDELVAIDGWRVPAEGEGALLKLMPPTREVALTVSRRGALRQVLVTLGEEPAEAWNVEVDPDATAEAVSRRGAWLGLSGLTPAP